MGELLDGLGIVGDMEAADLDAGVGATDEVAGKDLRRLHGPEARAVEGAEAGVVAVLFDGVRDAVGQNDGVFAADDLVERDELFGAHEGAGAVVDEDMRDVGRKRREGVHDRVLPLASAVNEHGGSGRVGGKFHHLALVAVNDDVEVSDTALHEGGRGMCKDWTPGEGARTLSTTAPAMREPLPAARKMAAVRDIVRGVER